MHTNTLSASNLDTGPVGKKAAGPEAARKRNAAPKFLAPAKAALPVIINIVDKTIPDVEIRPGDITHFEDGEYNPN